MTFLRRAKKNHYLFVLLILGPVFLLFLFIRIIPVMRTVYLSFTEYSMITKPRWIGLANYINLLQDENFAIAIANTGLIALACVSSVVLLALIFAVLMSNVGRSSSFYSLTYFIPVVVPWVPAAVIWRWILDPKFGVLNYGLSLLHIAGQAWLQRPHQVLIALAIVALWKTVGYYVLIFLVGIRNIPEVYYEAAKIDGANGGQILLRITVPLLKPIILLSIVIAIIQFFNVFTLALTLSSSTQGSPSYEAKVLVWEIYKNAFGFHNMGYASAEAVVLLAIVIILILIQFRAIRYEV